jgi:SAM-dependent methyltransferase
MIHDKDFLSAVASYYSEKLAQHGQTPQGADWNSEESQTLRFEQLTKVIIPGRPFSVNDLGCGYGALYDYLRNNFGTFSYTGSDISEAMISAAQARHGRKLGLHYVVASDPPEVADYGVASGIFNVRLGHNDAEWRKYVEFTMDVLDRKSRLGFAFNSLSSYSDPAKMRDYLYYADPCSLFDFCKRRYSRRVALLHDYGLYEFTIIVRKDT